MKTKHPMKIAGKIIPAGTLVRRATLKEIRAVWPGIGVKKDSGQIGVWFEGLSTPTLVNIDQVYV